MSFDETLSRLPDPEQKIIREMMALFDSADSQVQEFAGQSGLRCKSGCGACCENPDVETTVAEVLPLAVHLWSQGLAESTLNNLKGPVPSKNRGQAPCIFYKPDPFVPHHGRCGIYAWRPGLCRLFGFAGRRTKYGHAQLATCKIIKDTQPQVYKNADEKLQKGDWQVPLLTAYAQAVTNIDPVHGRKFFPINEAMALGLEKTGYLLEKSNNSC